MRVGVLRVEMLIPTAHSLKEKRRPLKGLMEKVRNRFHVSVAEVDCQELHQRAVVGIALVASDGGALAREMQAVRAFVENNPDCQVLDIVQQSMGWRADD